VKHRIIDSPLGPLTLVVNAEGFLCALYNDGQKYYPDAEELGERDDTIAASAVAELAEYFAGTRAAFSVPTAASGTDFQRRVWAALTGIPAGQTRTYGEIARATGASGRLTGGRRGDGPQPDQHHRAVPPPRRRVRRDDRLRGRRRSQSVAAGARARAGLLGQAVWFQDAGPYDPAV
jgi:methylated-DNA-[protein]-cysteine S-methyltransferase